MICRWKRLAFFLIVKYNDMVVKPSDANGAFERSQYGHGKRVQRPGFPERFARELIKQTDTKFLVPKEEKK
jgi:hypothetical protein